MTVEDDDDDDPAWELDDVCPACGIRGMWMTRIVAGSETVRCGSCNAPYPA